MNSCCTWKHAIIPLLDVRMKWNDKLEVVHNSFHLTKGQIEGANGQLSLPDIDSIETHLNILINHTAKTHLSHLKETKEYETLADFKREFKNLNTLISDLRYTFKGKFEPLYECSSKFFNEIVEYKKTLSKPLDRPLKHITYNERTELSSIKAFHSKRVPVSDTLAAALAALKLSEPKIDESLEYFVEPFFWCLSACSKLKIFAWNPLEFLYKGQVTTRTPIKWAIDGYFEENKHIQAFQKYSIQLLNCPIITNEVAEAFVKLAPYATTLDLKNADLHLQIKTCCPQIELKTLQKLLEAAAASKLCNTVHISKALLAWDETHDFLTRHKFYPTDEYPNSVTYNRKILF